MQVRPLVFILWLLSSATLWPSPQNPELTSPGLRPDYPASHMRRQFDRLDLAFNGGQGYKTSTNESATLAWGESYIMMSYLSMFEGTGDPAYLFKLADHADHVLSNRDDARGVADYRGVSGASWRNLHYQTNNDPYCYVVHSGMITYPMVRFAYLLEKNSAFRFLKTADGMTLQQKADTFVERAEETVAFHEVQWSNGPGTGEGFYAFLPDAPPSIAAGVHLPLNQQNALGRTLVMLAEVTGVNSYRDKAERLANYYRNRMQVLGNGYTWSYWPNYGSSAAEDLSHAAINADFAFLCEQAGIVFDSADTDALAATFTENITKSDAEVWGRVDGTLFPHSYAFASGRWLGVQAYDSSQLAYFTTQGVHEGVFDLTSTGSGAYLLSIANLARGESSMQLKAAYTGPGSGSEWADVCGADLDGDGTDEVAAVRNADGRIYGYRVDLDTGRFLSYANLPTSHDWGALTAGDLDGDGDEELIAASTSNGKLYFYDSSGLGDLFESGVDLTPGSGSEWAGLGFGSFGAGLPQAVVRARNFDGYMDIVQYDKNGSILSLLGVYADVPAGATYADLTVGDFDGDGFDEIAVARSDDAQIYYLELNGATIEVFASTTGWGPASNWAALTAGDFDKSGREELVMARNFDGLMFRTGPPGFAVDSSTHALVGASWQWGGMGALDIEGFDRPLLVGCSNRNGNWFVYGWK